MSSKPLRRYAEGTKVAVAQSRAVLDAMLRRYGASHIQTYDAPDKWQVACKLEDRFLRFSVERSKNEAEDRRRWRALILVLKAKIESWQGGVESFEEAFLSAIVLPNAETAGAWLAPQIKAAYASGKMPASMALEYKPGAK